MKQKETVLIVGASGYFGSYLCSRLQKNQVITASSSDPFADIKINGDGTLEFRREISRIDIAIFCTAFSKIEACENDPAQALYINCVLPTKIHNELRKTFSYFPVIISTDAVFHAVTSTALNELSTTNPLSVYGKTRRALEESFSSQARAAIIRPPRIWGGRGEDFVQKLSQQLTSQQVVYAIDDQYFCPLHIDDAIILIEKIAQAKQAGLYHIPGPELLSWHSIIKRLSKNLNVTTKIERKSLNTTYVSNIRPPWSNLTTNNQFINEFNKKCIPS